jgi:hypothetical protein
LGPATPEGKREEAGRRFVAEGEFARSDGAVALECGLLEEVVAKETGGVYRVEGEEDEAGVGREKIAAEFEEGREVAFDFPKFVVGTATESGRVEEDGVVVIFTADFSLHEFGGIFYYPADGCQSETG